MAESSSDLQRVNQARLLLLEANDLQNRCETLVRSWLRNPIPNLLKRPDLALSAIDIFLEAYQLRANVLARVAELDPDILHQVKSPDKPTGAETCFHAAGRPPTGR